MTKIPTFEQYVSTLGRMTAWVSPLIDSELAFDIRLAARSLDELEPLTLATLIDWVAANPKWVPVLGLAMGMTQETLKNTLKHSLGSSSWRLLALEDPGDLVEFFDREFGLLALLNAQRARTYDFADLLVARAGTRATAQRATASGRQLEDYIEEVAQDLGLPFELRGRFTGRNNRSAPADLIIPNAAHPIIVVAAKGFDSTGSKLTDAVREIEEMAEVRLPRQFVFAVIDGIGWKSRLNDLRRIHALWEAEQIDGLYTRATFDEFSLALTDAAIRAQLIE